MKLKVTALTHVGLKRSGNEDSFLAPSPVDETPFLVAVADGMGGHEGGEVASALALEVMGDWTEKLHKRGAKALAEAVLDANRVVWQRARTEAKLSRMGTTLTAAWIDGDTASFAHVGDSRAYLMRGGRLEQLTKDQTVVQQLIDAGEITENEAVKHPQRSFLLQSVGTEPDVQVDEISVVLSPGDRLLIASDGLHGYVSADDIAEYARETDAARACQALVDAANKAGGHDNVTVIVVDAQATVGDVVPTETEPIIVSLPEIASPKKFTANKLIPLAVLLVALLAAVVGKAFLSQATSQFIVTERAGKVVVLEGTAPLVGELPTGKIVNTSDVMIASLPDATQKTLVNEGIAKPTLVEALKVIDNYRRSLPAKLDVDATPTPAPTTPFSTP